MNQVKAFYEPKSSTLCYVVWSPKTLLALIIDPVLGYDKTTQQKNVHFIDEILHWLKEHSLKLHWVLETHVHADHLTASAYLKSRYPDLLVAISEKITSVQKTFTQLYQLEAVPTDGSQFDRLLTDSEEIQWGDLCFQVLHTPGHTPACCSFYFKDGFVFTGDTLFMPDFGTGRCDFPGGSSEELFNSIQKLYTLPETTQVFVGHDYQPGGRELAYQTSIGQSKKQNIHVQLETRKNEFIHFRNNRDQTLQEPLLLKPSLIANIQAGELP